ncbi:putative cytochrome b5-like heme/steroid binding domain superfamily [Helianthus debilis subsp. tardiflorus]
MMAVEFLVTLEQLITAYTGLSPNTFFTVIAAGIVVYYIFSVLFGGSSDHHQHRLRSFEEDVQLLPPPVQLGEIFEVDLKAYDGTDPQKPLLMVIKSQIYDVSQSRCCFVLLLDFLQIK